ncbi:hypothetical protein ACEQ8H_008392 [Pleosporales sp. CAS-2024a]
MDSAYDTDEPLSDAESRRTDWTAVHRAMLNEDAQWVHEMNLLDAHHNRVRVVAYYRYTPTQTFQDRYARRLAARPYPNRRRRSRSAPAPHRTAWRVQPAPALATACGDGPGGGRFGFDMLRRVKNSGVQKLRRANKAAVDKLRRAPDAAGNVLRWTRGGIESLVHSVRRLQSRNACIAMGVVGIGLLFALAYTNSRAAHYKALQATPASLYVGSFAHHPTWLHTDPVQVIGLPAQVDPSFIPSRDSIIEACARYKSTWHTDRLRVNGLTRQQALAVMDRGNEACDLLEQYHDNQYCSAVRDSIADFNGPAPAGASHFAKDCACTYARYLRAWWYQLLVPVDLQPDPPQTVEETCPCTYDMAMASWRSFAFDATHAPPPYLDRIKNDLALATTDGRVLWWRVKGFVFHDDRTFSSKDAAMACAMGEHEGCKSMRGWTSFSDFYRRARHCRGTRKLPDHRDFIEADDDEAMDPSDMSEEYKQAVKEQEEAEADAELLAWLDKRNASRAAEATQTSR